ncbi:hypothetical protein ACPOL_3912 [Acidisarcina polymorpha]|uniref:Uncharacterized protein n=1 Tax=Acidisarcina polymorpha TaxID=2211140 RepID=A0A2Z5G263_9BACT|nr:hypothetical protein ACPOL_3912 [Acidisarcina polymorpha]
MSRHIGVRSTKLVRGEGLLQSFVPKGSQERSSGRAGAESGYTFHAGSG